MIINDLSHIEVANQAEEIQGGVAYADAYANAYGTYFAATYTSTYASSGYGYYYYGPYATASSTSSSTAAQGSESLYKCLELLSSQSCYKPDFKALEKVLTLFKIPKNR